MTSLTHLPYDALDYVLRWLGVHDADVMARLMCVSKTFNDKDPLEMNMCDLRARKLLEWIYSGSKLTRHRIHKDLGTTRWTQALSTARGLMSKKVHASRRAILRGRGVLWKASCVALECTLKLRDRHFADTCLRPLLRIYLGQSRAKTYAIWDASPNKRRFRVYFEEGLTAAVRLVFQAVLDVFHNRTVPCSRVERRRVRRTVLTLNDVLNPCFRRRQAQPGLYETLDSKNRLYDRLHNAYDHCKSQLNPLAQNFVSSLVFDRRDQAALVAAAAEDAIGGYSVLNLKKYLRARHMSLSGRKTELAERVRASLVPDRPAGSQDSGHLIGDQVGEWEVIPVVEMPVVEPEPLSP